MKEMKEVHKCRMLFVVSLCLLSVFVSGCRKASLRAQLKELMGSTIVLPERVTCVRSGEIYAMPDSVRDKAKLIVYIDSTVCTTCRISHFPTYDKMFELSGERDSFEVILLLPSIDLYGIPVARYLSDIEYDYPIYVDDENRFLELNPSIPLDEKRLHSFLVSNEGMPICVGDPTASDKMLQVFMEAANHLSY